LKKIITSSLLVLSLTSNLIAYDNYAKYSILYSVPNDLTSKSNGMTDKVTMNSGFAIEAAVGHKLSSDLAVEAQYSYDYASTKNANGNIKIHSLFVNGVYNFPVDTKTMQPYLGMGLGAAFYTDGNADTTVLAYQGFLGTSFDIDYNLETFVEYKYKDFVDVELDNIEYSNTAIHSIGVGLKSKF